MNLSNENRLQLYCAQTRIPEATLNQVKDLIGLPWIAADKFQDKVKILLARIFPTREVMSDWYSIPSSSKKVYFYYLTRPYKLFLKYGKFILEICRS